MAITHSYVDYGGGNDTTGDGSVSTPWKTLQKAFDTLTRNTTDGNQVNLKAGTAHVNAAALDLATFISGGALAAAAPLIVRGYTTAANDGGIGEIDCGGATMWAAATYDYVMLIDLEMHSFGDNHGVHVNEYCVLFRCEIHKGASTPDGKALAYTDANSIIMGCYLHDVGAYGYGLLTGGGGGIIRDNFIDIGPAGRGIYCLYIKAIHSNIIRCTGTGVYGIYIDGPAYQEVIGNVIYNTTAGTASGIYMTGVNGVSLVQNNIIVGFSGAGGEGVYSDGNMNLLGYNAFYNNTANYTLSEMTFIDLTAADVALAADPFTGAATGDFSLTDAGKTALRGMGWPAAFLGAHASTDGHVTIGAIQYGEAEAAGGGFPKIASLLGRTRM